MEYQIRYHDKFKFVEEGSGEPLVLLHGLFGALSNFEPLIEYFRNHARVIVPLMPLLEMDILHTSVGGLAKFVNKFLEAREMDNVNPVSYTHLRAHETPEHLVCRLLLEKK